MPDPIASHQPDLLTITEAPNSSALLSPPSGTGDTRAPARTASASAAASSTAEDLHAWIDTQHRQDSAASGRP